MAKHLLAILFFFSVRNIGNTHVTSGKAKDLFSLRKELPNNPFAQGRVRFSDTRPFHLMIIFGESQANTVLFCLREASLKRGDPNFLRSLGKTFRLL